VIPKIFDDVIVDVETFEIHEIGMFANCMEVNKIVLDLKVCVSILDSNSSFSFEYAQCVYYILKN
jgi:hypothetical protein